MATDYSKESLEALERIKKWGERTGNKDAVRQADRRIKEIKEMQKKKKKIRIPKKKEKIRVPKPPKQRISYIV